VYARRVRHKFRLMDDQHLDEHREHPVRLLVEDDLRRSRLTVFFRIILAIPHLVWAFLWTIAVFFASIANWVYALIAGTPGGGLHRFMCSYVRYLAHLTAYLRLAANPYPGFVGEEGTYPVDVALPGPAPQPRWKTFIRIFLALPALIVSSALGSSANFQLPTRRSGGATYFAGANLGGVAAVAALLGWFASLAQARMPKGLRDAGAYSVGYGAQALAYLLLVTDSYPNSDPTQMLESVDRPPLHPVHLVGEAHDLRRSRMLVVFRLPLAIPHLVWLVLWGIVVFVVVILNWFVAVVRGTPAAAFHRFTARYVRYSLHVYAFLSLAANPFPGFAGQPGRYPLDLELPDVSRQNRWITGFRVILLIPALLMNTALSGALWVAAFFVWWVALVRGTAPWGLRNLSAYALRYQAQYNAYALLLTDRYPHASPLEGAEPAQQQFELEPA
jgi:Domain of unknown function (DUF4389)